MDIDSNAEGAQCKPSVSEAVKQPASGPRFSGQHEAHEGSNLRSTWKPATPSSPQKTGSSLRNSG